MIFNPKGKAMKKSFLNASVLSFATACVIGLSSAAAADGTWNVNASGSWNTASNWDPVAVPGGAGSTVNLTYDLSGTNATVTINTTSATVGTLNIGDSGTGTDNQYTVSASGGAKLIMDNNGSQAQILASGSAQNSFNAPIEINAQGLLIRNSSASNLNMNAGATISSTTSGTLELDGASAGLGVSGIISGNAAVLVNSSGGNAVSISGSNTYSGGTTVRRGVFVSINHDKAFGTGGVTLGGAGSTGTVFAYSSSTGRVIANNLTVSNATANTLQIGVRGAGTSLEWTGDIDLQRNLELKKDGTTAGKITLSTGVISGTGKLTLVNDTNTTRLSSTGSFSGGVSVAATNATLELGSTTALGTGTLSVSGSNFSIDAAGSDLTLSTNNAIALTPSGTKALTYVGTGGAHLNLGTGTMSFSGNKTFTVTAGVLTIGGSVVGGAGFYKEGAGTLALNGANTYSGDTEVRAGTLRGTGSLAGAVYVSSGATLEAGNSIGTFTAAGDAGFLDGSTFKFELNSTLGTFDLLVANGLSLENSNVTLSVAELGGGAWSGTNTFTIINNTSGGAVAGTFLGRAEGSNVVIGANTFKISYLGGTGNDVTLSLVPEPGTWFLVTFGLAFILFRRRRARVG